MGFVDTLGKYELLYDHQLTINSGVTLTIESGVEIFFLTASRFEIYGRLEATDTIFDSDYGVKHLCVRNGGELELTGGAVNRQHPELGTVGPVVVPDFTDCSLHCYLRMVQEACRPARHQRHIVRRISLCRSLSASWRPGQAEPGP